MAMRKLLILMIFILSIIAVTGCSLIKFNYAKVTIVNRWSKSIVYKGFFIDERSSNVPGKMTINVILPTNSPIKAGVKDSYEMNWSDTASSVTSWVSWGAAHPTDDIVNVYERSTDHFPIKDGQHVIIEVSTDTVPNGYIVTFEKL
jgi:hypothetical protein